MHANKQALSRISPLVDAALVYIFTRYSTDITKLLAPILGWPNIEDVSILQTTPFICGAAIAAIPLMLMFVGFYRGNNLQRTRVALKQLSIVCAYIFTALAIYLTLHPHSQATNHAITINMIGIPIAILLRYYSFKLLLTRTALASCYLRHVLLVGNDDDVKKGWAKLPTYWTRTMENPIRHIPGQTSNEELREKIILQNPDLAIFFGGMDTQLQQLPVIQTCRELGINLYFPISSSPLNQTHTRVEAIGNHHMLIVSNFPDNSWAPFIKSCSDRIIALLLLICSSPLWLIAAIIIKRNDPSGSIFYSQERSGLYGKPFKMWKFRSMDMDADKRLNEIKATHGNDINGPIFKLDNDPRIFAGGNFLRKYSIDELPQMLNILMGDMSIVGPRPLPIYETAEFPELSDRLRLSVKPGLTCYWQIEDRSDAKDFKTLVEKDIKYINNWSLWLDFTLIIRTIPAVLLAKGAK